MLFSIASAVIMVFHFGMFLVQVACWMEVSRASPEPPRAPLNLEMKNLCPDDNPTSNHV